MNGNLRSSRVRAGRGDPMREHDAMPEPLRRWATTAALPWSVRSLRRAWSRAMAATGCPEAAIRRIAAAEAKTLAREARQVWGKAYPAAGPATVGARHRDR
ncbi:MAG: DUF6525 family protein [Tabrizicola sp.]